MKYKLIAMDFDGTLLTDDKKIMKKTATLLSELKQAGYIIVGATARPLEGAKDVVDINLFNYLILNNGAYIYDVQQKQGRYLNSITKEEAKRITKTVEHDCTQIDYCSGTMYYIYKQKKGNLLPFIKDIETVDDISEDVARMNLFLTNQTKVEYYKDLLSKIYPKINPFIMQDSTSTMCWLVVNPEKLDKKESLQILGHHLEITPEEMIFFGDGRNDIEVMEFVGCSVAMGNALPEVKERASIITTSNNEDGIAVFLSAKLNPKNHQKTKR